MMTGTQLDNGLLYAGLGVWGILLIRCIRHGNFLRIDPKPDPSAIHLNWQLVALVLVFFLMISGLIREVWSVLRIHPDGPPELRELTFQMLTDCVAKTLAAMGMIVILQRTMTGQTFWGGKTLFKSDKPGRVTFWIKLPALAMVIYLAGFPWINKFLLWIGVLLADKVFNLSAPQGHQVFQLLNSPHSSLVIKTFLILLAVVISPIAEELFFRGMVQNLAYKKFRHTGLAITLTAVIFTAVHIPMYHQFLSLFALGLVLGWSYYRFRSLLVPIAVHILFNATTLILWSLGFAE